VLGLGRYDRCNAQLEFLNGFDSALLLHCSTPAGSVKTIAESFGI
jgi:hypothetical protein